MNFPMIKKKYQNLLEKAEAMLQIVFRLLNLPNEIISYVENEEIMAGHAKILVNLPNAQFIAKKIIDKKTVC